MIKSINKFFKKQNNSHSTSQTSGEELGHAINKQYCSTLDENADTGLKQNPEVTSSSWEPPNLPTSSLPIPLKLQAELLPASIRKYIFKSAYRLDNAPPEYVAVSIIVAAATVIGGSAVITPKEFDKKWKLVPVIWAALVGPPSYMKTPAMDIGLKLLEKL